MILRYMKKRWQRGLQYNSPKKLQKPQSLLIQARMTQIMRMKRSLKKVQAMEKKLKRPRSLKVHQSHQSLLTQATKNRGLKSIKRWKNDRYKGKEKSTKVTRVY